MVLNIFLTLFLHFALICSGIWLFLKYNSAMVKEVENPPNSFSTNFHNPIFC